MVNSIENELIIITKQTFDAFLKTDIPADLIALYNFYYYTAKWQETNQPKCTTGYTADGLKWSEAKVRRAKKELLRLGLVEDVQQKVNGKVSGCFIKLNYIIKQETVSHPNDFSQGGKEENHPNDFSQGGNVHRVENLQTNALSSNNINALSANNINASKERKKKAGSYDDILSDIDDSELKELYFEYIKMRKLIKKPMTDRALKMLVSKVNALEPISIDRQKKLLENAISSNWLSVYPLKDENKQGYNQNKKTVPASSDYDFELENFWNM